MKRSPARHLALNTGTATISGSKLCEIGLDQRAKLRRHLGPLSKPELEPRTPGAAACRARRRSSIRAPAPPPATASAAAHRRDRRRRRAAAAGRHRSPARAGRACRATSCSPRGPPRQQFADRVHDTGCTWSPNWSASAGPLNGPVGQIHPLDAALDQPNTTARDDPPAPSTSASLVAWSSRRPGVEIVDEALDIGVGRAQLAVVVPQRIGGADRAARSSGFVSASARSLCGMVTLAPTKRASSDAARIRQSLRRDRLDVVAAGRPSVRNQ